MDVRIGDFLEKYGLRDRYVHYRRQGLRRGQSFGNVLPEDMWRVVKSAKVDPYNYDTKESVLKAIEALQARGY